MQVHAVRLVQGQELKQEISNFILTNNLSSAFILTCVGSLTKATLRLATQTDSSHTISTFTRNSEILSLVGTISSQGQCHLHISLGDSEGCVIGGHLVGDAIVQTTAEIVIGSSAELTFTREFDPNTGFTEICVHPSNT
eukprot:TRINITY_DN12633_c0_g1_i1.p1 TRINITY_DN12633_c0_g1~~TRINITY_DN12633_c0_g1_i1.p1  ORF type:complete len:139 (+),score=37.48 TRINITY_DN12633_c0_g1_i1:2-418(+)